MRKVLVRALRASWFIRLNKNLYAAALLAFLFSPPAHADGWYPSLADIAGCVDGICPSPDAACASIAYFYDSPWHNTYLGESSGVPHWICKYFYTITRTQVLYSSCLLPQKDDITSITGCTTPPYPKDDGDGGGSGGGGGGNGPKKPGQCPQPVAGDPVTICSGNKYQEATDYQGTGNNALVFSRSYNGISIGKSALGISWRHNFERSLILTSSTKITAVRGDGQELNYSKSGGVWSSDKDVTLSLVAITGGYELYDNDKTKETYDSAGVLQSIEKLNGYTQTLTYTSGKLTSVSDNLGRSLSFTYNTNGLLETLTDPDSKVYSYAYAVMSSSSEEYMLSTVTYPDDDANPSNNPYITYHYENTIQPTVLTGLTDELGHRYATWGYDNTGRATLSKLAGDVDETTFTYNTDGTTTVTYPLGEVITYTYSTIQNGRKIVREDRAANASVPAAYRTYSYDSNGFLSSVRDWNGNITNFVYNSSGLQTSRTEAYGTAQARTITTTWNTSLRVPTQIAEPGKTTDFTYDSDGNLLTKTETDTATSATRSWTYTYDSLGNVLTVNGPRTDVSDVTTFTYTTTAKNLATVTDALSHVTTVTSYNNRGLPLSYTDQNGTVIDLTYDALGRLKTHTVHSSGGNAVTTIAYNAAGVITRITQPDGSYLDYEYDDAQRLTAVQNNGGFRIEYTLDDAGNITQELRKSSSGSLRYQQSHTYDALGRLLKDIGYSAAQETTYGYDANGNRVSSKDARNYTTSFAFDALNRLITVTDPLTKTADTGYDARDNVTSRSDFKGYTTTYTYNGFNQLTSMTSPDTGTTTYTPDKAGNVVSETNARSITTTRTFDALNRMTSETYTSSSENVAYTYDDTTGGNEGIGRLTGWSDQSGSVALTYDDRGNVVRRHQVIGARSYDTYYSWTLGDKLSMITYPSGRQVQYTRNSSAWINAVNHRVNSSSPWYAVAGSITYESYGPIKSLIYGNGLTLTRTWNKNYWLTGISSIESPTTVQNLTLGYDNAGNLTSVTDAVTSSRNQSFTLDALNRITQAASAGTYGTVNFTYDDNGNRKTRVSGGVTETYNYATGMNRLSTITGGGSGTRSFNYRNNGLTYKDSRASGTTDDLEWIHNKRDRVSELKVNTVSTATYLYSADGSRASKTYGGASTHYLYDEEGNLLAEHNGSTGAVIREYVYLEGMPLAQVEGGNSYYFHSDQVNQPQKITDASDTIVWNRFAQPFGENVSVSGATATPLRFPGQYSDPEDANSYNYFRDYDPTLGRYLQPDPIGLDGGLNLYGYATQNPLLNVDPLGLKEKVLLPVPLPIPPVVIPGSPSNSEFSKNLTSNIKNSIYIYQLMGMILGNTGREKGENEYTRAAKSEAQQSGKDPCHVLKEWLKEAHQEKDVAAVKKIEQAEKFLGCRNKRKRDCE